MFYNTVNNASAVITAPHIQGDGVLNVNPVTVFGSGFPLRVTCFRQGDGAVAIYSIGSSGATSLNITGTLEGTSDIDFYANDICQADITAGTINDIHRFVEAVAASSAAYVPISSTLGKINLPNTIYGVVGHETTCFFDNIIRSYVPTNYYEVDVISNYGKQWEDRWTFTPVIADTGNQSFSISASFLGAQVDSKTCTLKVKPASAAASVTRKVFTIGDSTSESGIWLAELVNLCNYNKTSPTLGGGADNLTITTVGRKTSIAPDAQGNDRTVKHEATGGWSAYLYYTHATSPFVFSGVFNSTQYFNNNSITLASGDWVLIHLGINDVFFSTSDANAVTNIQTSISSLNSMIQNMKLFQGGLRFGLFLPIPPNKSQNSFGYQYNCTYKRAKHKRWIDLYQESMLANFGNAEASNIFLFPIHMALDTLDSMPESDKTVAPYNPMIVGFSSNALHPGTIGQFQMGKGAYLSLRGQEL